MISDRGAVSDYTLLISLVAVISIVPLYRYFQAQTKPFCQILDPLSIEDGVNKKKLRFGKNLHWGAASEGGKQKLACYVREITLSGKSRVEKFSPQFYAGSIIIEN